MLSLTLALCLSLFLSLYPFLSPPLSLAHILLVDDEGAGEGHQDMLSLSHTHTLSLTHTLSHSHTQSLSHTLTHTHCLSLTYTHLLLVDHEGAGEGHQEVLSRYRGRLVLVKRLVV